MPSSEKDDGLMRTFKLSSIKTITQNGGLSMDRISRKDFLVKGLVTGAAVVGAGAILAACKKEEKKAEASAASCNDVTGLSPDDIQQRTNLQYVDQTPDPSKRCDGCALYVAPAAGATCGGCNLIKGPISPAGYCTSWVQKS
jgi:hypothetical protein